MNRKENGNVAQGANSQESEIKFLVVITCPADQRMRDMVEAYQQMKQQAKQIEAIGTDDLKKLHKDMLLEMRGNLLGEIQARGFKICIEPSTPKDHRL